MKNFYMRNEDFICENCNKTVSKANKSVRDHCPYCLYSKHVDLNPGDRLNPCFGMLKPIEIEKFKNTFKIIYKCEKCSEIEKNIVNEDDDMDKIIQLSVKK